MKPSNVKALDLKARFVIDKADDILDAPVFADICYYFLLIVTTLCVVTFTTLCEKRKSKGFLPCPSLSSEVVTDAKQRPIE